MYLGDTEPHTLRVSVASMENLRHNNSRGLGHRAALLTDRISSPCCRELR